METENNYEYDLDIDSCYIYDNSQKEDVFGSLAFGNLIFDINNSGKVIGLEIENASVFLGIEPEKLSQIKEVKLNILKQKNGIFLGFIMSIENKIYNYSYIFPKNKIALTV